MRTQPIHTPKLSVKKSYLIPIENSGTKALEIQENSLLGRDNESEILIADPIVSRRHAKIEFSENGYKLRDLNSANGTFVNQRKIKEVYLNEGDKVRIGSREFIFTLKEQPPLARPSDATKNKAMKNVYDSIPGIAQTSLPVLLLGESGTGKEVIAKLIYQESLRHEGPFVSINCSSLSSNIIESELFGHKKGSFTDAHADRLGAFEMARGGTLVLDEIGDLPLELQPKLLRALENKEIRPIGSDKTILTNVRIIASTHKSLKDMVALDHFRADLYYRLNVIQVSIPNLQQRMEDFEDLLYNFCREMRVSFSHMAIERLKQHPWPGNIRELKNMVARASALFKDKRIEVRDLDLLVEMIPIANPQIKNLSSVDLLERDIIKKRLRINKGNQRRTALELGIPKSTLNDKIKKLGINPKDFK